MKTIEELRSENKHPIVYGFGIRDYPTSENGIQSKQYKIWKAMLRRCYSKNYQETAKTYIGCTVSDNFLRFSYFYKWCESQKGFNLDGFELDKDILKKGNKVYSENSCCFVPREINSLIINQKNRRGSLLLGVAVNKKGKYQVNMSFNNSGFFVGAFDDAVEAFNAYKRKKEQLIKLSAEKWRGCISEDAYSALIGYSVEVDD